MNSQRKNGYKNLSEFSNSVVIECVKYMYFIAQICLRHLMLFNSIKSMLGEKRSSESNIFTASITPLSKSSPGSRTLTKQQAA